MAVGGGMNEDGERGDAIFVPVADVQRVRQINAYDDDVFSEDNAQDIPLPRDELLSGDHDITAGRKLGYALGHFYNDLCASMWFTYLMLFMEKVVGFESWRAGLLMLVGQATDAICTPIVGYWSDANILPRGLQKLGRRISWHIIGTICVTLSFPFIFNECLFCSSEPGQVFPLLWFIPFIMLFQFGWASVQISHLALIPELSSVSGSRTTMNSLRYGFTVLSNIAVFVAFYFLLSSSKSNESIGPSDLEHFRLAGFLVVGAGLLVTLIFYATTREPQFARRLSRLNSISSDTSTALTTMRWTSWFGHAQFYQVYFPFYIQETQGRAKEYVAIFPMVSYISSFLVSTIISIPWMSHRLSRKALFLVGCILGIGSCGWMHFSLPGIELYAVSVLMGITQAVLLVTSLAITADLINKNTESGAFVYGAMSFVDKLANGIAYQITEIINPCSGEHRDGSVCSSFYRTVMVFAPGGCLIIALIVLLMLIPQNVGKRPVRRPRRAIDDDENVLVHNEEPIHTISD